MTSSPAKVEFLKFSELKQTTTTRIAEYKVSTCLKSQPNAAIFISSTNQTVKTDHSGCLSWTESLSHKVYAPEKDYVRNVTLTDTAIQQTTTLTLLLNPLRIGRDSGLDLRSATAERKSTPARPAPSIFLTSMNIQLNGSDYQVDNLLNISLKRRYLFNATPQVVRYDSQSSTLNRTEPLRDGNYYFRATVFRGDRVLVNSGAFLTEKQEPVEIIDSKDMIVTVLGGQLSAIIEFNTRDLVTIGTRNTLAIEIYPLNEEKVRQFTTENLSSWIDFDSGLGSRVYFCSFIPVSENSQGLFPHSRQDKGVMNQLIADFKDTANKRETQTNSTDLEQATANESGLALFLPNSPLYQKIKVNPNPFLKLAETGLLNTAYSDSILPEIKTSLSQLCYQSIIESLGFGALVGGKQSARYSPGFVKANNLLQTCQKNPTQFFTLNHVLSVTEVEKAATRWLGGKSQSFNISSSFDLTMGHSLSSSLSNSVSLGMGASFRPLTFLSGPLSKVPLLKDLFSGSIDYGYTFSSSHSDNLNQGNGHTVSFSRGLYLVEQQADLQITAKKYRRCLTVLFNAESLSFITRDGVVPEWALHGFQFCGEEENEPITFVENFFFFSQQFAAGDFVDNHDIKNRPFVLSLRGLRDYFVFLGVTNKLLDPSQADNATKSNPQDLFLRGMKLFEDQSRAIPGQYNTFNNIDQVNFAFQNSEISRTKAIYNELRQTLSPWVRKNLTPHTK